MPSSANDDWFDGFLDVIRDHGRRRPRVPERYSMGDTLGEGAAAVVYRARDRELGRDVAVKLLRDPLGSNATVRERFLREAHVSAGISHPNVVAVHDLGEVDGRLFIVMELVEGRPFGEVAKGGGLPDRVLLLEKAARGVGAAHAKGVVHRDLKPANILVGRSGEPKVGDFGLAHVAGAETGLTRSGVVMGTPLYMAPEQVHGQLGKISPRTDVYALGAMLYEILTGRPPHNGDTVTEIYGKIVGEEPAAPRRLNPSAPRDLETIALKAIEKGPERRYEDADAFADDLRRWREGEPILARPPGPVQRWWRRVRRRRALLGAAAALLAAAGAWLVVDAVRFRNRIGNLLAQGAKAEEDRRPGDAQAHYRSVLSLDAANTTAIDGLRRAEALQASIERRNRAIVANLGGKALLNAENFDAAIREFDKAIEADPTLMIAWGNRALTWMRKGDLEKARADCDDALRLDPKHPFVLALRGEIRHRQGDLDGALEDLRKVLQTVDPDWEGTAEARLAMANLRGSRARAAYQRGDHAASLREIRAALKIAPPDWGHRANAEQLAAELRKILGPREE